LKRSTVFPIVTLLATTSWRAVAIAAPTRVPLDLDSVAVATVLPKISLADVQQVIASGDATPIDSSVGVPKMSNPEHGGALAIVRMRNPSRGEDHNAADWMRFFTSTPDVAPYLLGCERSPSERSVGPRLTDSFLLQPTATGYRYRATTAWFDGGRCSGFELDHVDVAPTPIAGSAAFVYRTECPDCLPKPRARIHALWPWCHHADLDAADARSEYWTYQMTEISWAIAPGQSANVTCELNPDDLAKWNRILIAPIPIDAIRVKVHTEADERGILSGWVETETIEAWRS
jgi:hypothetical protein